MGDWAAKVTSVMGVRVPRKALNRKGREGYAKDAKRERSSGLGFATRRVRGAG